MANRVYKWSTTTSSYKLQSTNITTSDTPPSSPSLGDIWFNSTNVILYIRVNDSVNDIWLDLSSVVGSSVVSVAGKVGAVTLVGADVGHGNVDNTSDINKPVSTATQTALNSKQNTLTAGTNISIVGSTINANGGISTGRTILTSSNLALSDSNTRISCNHATTPVACTILNDSTIAWPNETVISIYQGLAAACSFAAGAGVTIHALDTSVQYGILTALKTGANEWTVQK